MRIFFTLSILLLFSIQGMSQSGLQETAVVKFYPNPAVSQITFDFPKTFDKSYTFQIYNFLGKKVFEQKNLNPKTTVELTQYFRGIYIFQLRDKTGKIVQTGRFQVSR
ncbi:T9SS type A sorting domain-containing protein [Flavihumibacter profundi]|uniref:T9SS type A sorting domain-containing protein n=1 Tax=Flavihumibacter profundi TaxID=2716883 RepID=UPI001CC7F4EF|nr:T9SS type A sorting domain-containing protein [Flavihumibacter profundi]MBZ5859254.1 T9SS type A sorting domain-containing protein [Flavihumibacter profundi]